MSMIALSLLLKLIFFNKLSAKYGLDSQVIVELCKTFASHVSIPKVKWDKYHEPY